MSRTVNVGDEVVVNCNLICGTYAPKGGGEGFTLDKGEKGYVVEVLRKGDDNYSWKLDLMFPGKGTSILVEGEFKFGSAKVIRKKTRTVKSKNLRLGDIVNWDGLESPSEVVSIAYFDVYKTTSGAEVEVLLIGQREEDVSVTLDANKKVEVTR